MTPLIPLPSKLTFAPFFADAQDWDTLYEHALNLNTDFSIHITRYNATRTRFLVKLMTHQPNGQSNLAEWEVIFVLADKAPANRVPRSFMFEFK